MMEYSMALSVSTRLTSMLSSSSFVVSNLPKALATLPGFGIKPFDVVCQIIKVISTCSTIMMTTFCLLSLPNGVNICLNPEEDKATGGAFSRGLSMIASICL